MSFFPNLEKTTVCYFPIHLPWVGMWPRRLYGKFSFNNLKFVKAGDEQEIRKFHPKITKVVTQRIV